MADPLGTAYVKVAPDLSSLTSQVGAYFASSKWGSVGRKAGIGLGAITVAGVAAGKALYEIGEQFDAASDTIRTRTGATGKELGKLETSFKNVVKAVPTDFGSASEAIAGLNQRLDLTGRPLERLSKQMLELSRITETDIGSNVQSVTRLFGDWSIATRKQSKTLDGLFRLSQETGIEVSELADTMVQFGSPMRTLGLDFDFAAAMIAKFEKEGVNMTTLMSGLRLSVANLSDPTDELSASFEKFGITAKEPAEQVFQVMEAIKQTASVTKGNTLAFEVFGRRAGSDMAAAIREGRFELDDLMKTMKGGKETIRGAGRETMDFAEHWQKFKNNVLVGLKPLATKVFEGIGDAMKDITDIISDPKLTGGEKFDKLVALGGKAMGELAGEIGEKAPKVAGAFVSGFLQAPVWGQLLVGAWFMKALGGRAAIGALGGRFGLAMAGPWGLAIAGGIEAALLGVNWEQGPGGVSSLKTTSIIPMWMEQFDLTQKKAEKLADYMKAHEGLSVPEALEAMKSPLIKAGGRFEDLSQAIRKSSKGTRDHVGIDFRKVGKTVEDETSQARRDATRESGKMAQGVVGNVGNMVNKASDGLRTLGDNLNEGLSAVEVKKVSFSIKKAAKTVGSLFRATGGRIPGYSMTDDTMVMARGGERFLTPEKQFPIADFAMQATFGQGLDDMLKSTGGVGYEKGGYVPHPAMGQVRQFAAGGLNPAISSIAKWAGSKYGATISSGFRPGDPGFHGQGAAVDLVSGNMLSMARGIAAQFGPQLAELIHTPLGYSIDNGQRVAPFAQADHYDHVHAAAFGQAIAAVVAKLQRVILRGPKGPLRRGGQGVLDMFHKAASAYRAKQLAKLGTVGSFGSVPGGTGAELMRAISEQRGWNFGDWWALDAAETSHGANLTNPSSSARLRGQFLDMNYGRYGPGSDPAQNPSMREQIISMADYIAERYGNPSAAWNFHQAHNWYRKGGMVNLGALGLPPYGGVFHNEGTVPGPLGAERTIIAEGGERVSKSAPVVHVTVVARGSVEIEDVHAVVDDRKAEIADFTLREGGRNRARSRQLAGSGGRA